MKRVYLIAALLAAAATMAEAQVTQVVSRNAVGYVKMNVKASPGGGSSSFFMGAMPFYEVGDDGEYTIGEIFGGQLNGGGSAFSSDNVIKFNYDDQGYKIFWKNSANGKWIQFPEDPNTETTNTLSPGEAFFIQNRATTAQVVYVLGEVPDRFTVPTSTQKVSIAEGFQMISYAFPTEVPINDTSLADNGFRGGSAFSSDQIIIFNPTGQNYQIYWLPNLGGGAGFEGWRKFPEGGDTPDTLKPGDGAFYLRRTGQPTFMWSEAKKYTWP